MLDSMRNWSKTWVAKILLGLLVVAFGAWGATDILVGGYNSILGITGWGPKDLVRVGDVTLRGDIYTENLSNALKRASDQSGQALTMDDARKSGLDLQVLEQMVSQAALGETVAKLKLVIPESTILNELMQQKSFQDSKGNFVPDTFRRALASSGVSEQAYFANQTTLRSQAAILNAASTHAALPQVFNAALAQFVDEQRDVKYFDVTATEADAVKPTDADLKATYEASPALYTAPEYRTAAVISVDAASLASQQAVTAEELAAGYEANKQAFFTPETRDIIQVSFKSLDEANKAKTEIATGKDLLAIATALGFKSEDVTLNARTRADFLDSKMADAAFTTAEGQVSDPIQGGLATAIIKVVKVTPENQQTLEQAKPALTSMLQLEKAKEKITDVYNQVEDLRASQDKKFEDIAKEVGLNITFLPPISQAGQNQKGDDLTFMVQPELLKAIFNSDVGVENDAAQIGEAYVWYDVRSVIPSALKPLEQVKDDVSKNLMSKRISEAAVAKVKKLSEELAVGKTFATALTENAAVEKTETSLRRNTQTDAFNGAMLNAAFAVPDQAYAYAAGGDGKSARVMQVTKITLPNLMVKSESIDAAKKEVQQGFASDLQNALVAALKKNAGVEINAELWKQNTGTEPPDLN